MTQRRIKTQQSASSSEAGGLEDHLHCNGLNTALTYLQPYVFVFSW